jgi:di/tricarboxylate transporter
VGDVLLLQGETQALEIMCSNLGCLGIKNRGIEIVRRRGTYQIPLIFALGILAAAIGLVPVQIAFMAVVGVLVILKLISLREAYRSIEWPIIVLLGFLIPVGEALQSTGATDMIARGILSFATDAPIWVMLGMLMVVSMLFSDLVHNSPTAVMMAPIAYSLAVNLDISPDPFLMAVAIGAASPYLTPIGHQSNTLVMGPGGYNFGDYWRMGLPLDIVIVTVGVPMIMWVWL